MAGWVGGFLRCGNTVEGVLLWVKGCVRVLLSGVSEEPWPLSATKLHRGLCGSSVVEPHLTHVGK